MRVFSILLPVKDLGVLTVRVCRATKELFAVSIAENLYNTRLNKIGDFLV